MLLSSRKRTSVKVESSVPRSQFFSVKRSITATEVYFRLLDLFIIFEDNFGNIRPIFIIAL